jgi:hypothetical protein
VWGRFIELRLLRLLRPGLSHHRGGASIGDPASRVPSET